MISLPPKPNHCELCGRAVKPLTRHHLIPKSQHQKTKIKKTFSREDCITQTLWLCRPCHSYIHKQLSEKELAMHYNSREALLNHPEIQTFVQWLASKPSSFKPKMPIKKRH